MCSNYPSVASARPSSQSTTDRRTGAYADTFVVYGRLRVPLRTDSPSINSKRLTCWISVLTLLFMGDVSSSIPSLTSALHFRLIVCDPIGWWHTKWRVKHKSVLWDSNWTIYALIEHLGTLRRSTPAQHMLPSFWVVVYVPLPQPRSCKHAESINWLLVGVFYARTKPEKTRRRTELGNGVWCCKAKAKNRIYAANLCFRVH